MSIHDSITRRQSLQLGVAAFGLSLPRLLAADAAGRSATRPAAAKSVIILYLSGGPSQLDMWDMKPNASEEVRGTFQPISTTVPGTQICEHLPRMAKLAHRYAIVRSMTHDEGDHLRAGHWILTGGRLNRSITAFSGMERSDFPHVGSVTAHEIPSHHVPPFVVVPEFVSPRGVPRPGQHAGFLGAEFDPYVINSDPNLPDYNPGPIVGSPTASLERVRARTGLLAALERKSPFATHFAHHDIEAYRGTALELVASTAARRAFDISAESARTRDRYGRHIFGQSTLVARRLVEAGVRVVQVTFIRHDDAKGGQGYDSHGVPPNPPHLHWAKEQLLPPTDAAFSALIEDLSDRGLLEETLVVMMGEFGRTPKFNSAGGRDHWPGCYSLIMAGGGIAPGAVYGKSDNTASTPVADPVGPNDILATVYRQLGIDHRRMIYDLSHRPHVIADGNPVLGLLS
jgi:uncharacterized protein (DUF1501 family)